jgi:anti-anti-sigma factor
MDNSANNKLLIKVSVATNMATIYLDGSFTFNTNLEFKGAYKSFLNDSKISHIIIDLEKIHYLDSSALGMLLVLRDHVQEASKSLVLSKPNSFVTRVFDIANFGNLFVIQ